MDHEDGRPEGRPGGGPPHDGGGGWAVPGSSPGAAPQPPQGQGRGPQQEDPRPAHGAPGPQEQGHGPQGYGPPGHQPPGYGPPGHQPPGYPQQGYGQQGYGPPAWGPPPAPRPGIVALRPLNLGDILNGAFGYIRGNPRTVLGLSFALGAVIALLPSLGAGTMMNDFDRLLTEVESGGAPESPFPLSGTAIGLQAAGVIVQLVGGAVLSGLLATVIGLAVLGRKLSAKEAFAFVRPRLGAVLGVAGLLSLVYIAWFAVLLIPVVGGAALIYVLPDAVWAGILVMVIGLIGAAVLGVWVYVRLALAMPATVLERIGAGRALARSWRLTVGSWWRVFGVLALTLLITMLVSSVLTTPFSMIGGFAPLLLDDTTVAAVVYSAALFLGTLLGTAVTMPFTSGVTGLVYVDLRMRREGLDLRLQAASQSGEEVGPEIYRSGDEAGPYTAGGPA